MEVRANGDKNQAKGISFVILLLIFGFIVSCNSQHVEDAIVLVGIDSLDREGIARELTIINRLEPKVVSVDLQFVNETDHRKDWLLFDALERCGNLVMASRIGDYTGLDSSYETFIEESEPQFLANAKTGFVNTILERDEFETLKRFSKAETVNGKIEYHFAVQTAMLYDSFKTKMFLEKTPRIVDVDYKNGRAFKQYTSEDVFNNRLREQDIKGKIVMIGYLGPLKDDMFFSPLNGKLPPFEPDIYGLEYLACIVAQALE